MRARQIMTRQVITIDPEASIVEAANTMLQYHIGGLPVVDTAGKLVGIVSEGDFHSPRGDRNATQAWPVVTAFGG